MHRRPLTFLLAALALLSLGAAPQPQRSVIYERYDVDIDIQADGSLLVAETYQLRFEGEFRTGFADIPLDYASDIVDVQVREGDQIYDDLGSGPGTFDVSREWDAMRVDWEYEPTTGSEVRTFTVSYRVLGGLWVYPEGDRLSWTAVPDDRSGIPVASSRVTVHLPTPVDPDDVAVASPGATAQIADAKTLVFESRGPVLDGTPLEVTVRLPHGLTAAAAPDWQRKIDEALATYRWTGFDVDLTIAPDGSLAVAEKQTLAVEEGYLYHGYRVIPWLYLDQITGVKVRSDERTFEFSTDPCEYCYVIEERSTREDWVAFNGRQVVINEDRVGSTLVEWAFPALEAGNSATFELNYTVLGALRVLTNAQEIEWTAVFADRDAPVDAASVTLHLPPDLNPDDVDVSGGATALQADGTVRVTHDGPVPAGEAWSVDIRMPVDATTAGKSIWQHELETQLQRERAVIEAERREAVRRARWQVGLGALGCLFPVLGLTIVITAWYVWGRDRPAPPVALYLTEPPSDLPPGIVAYLVDERPTVKGVLADLLHLATLGLISIDLQERDFTVRLNWTRQIDEGEAVRVADGEAVELVEHERTLFNMLVERIQDVIKQSDRKNKRKGLPIRFSKIETTFTRVVPTIYEQMGEVASQYFSTLPETARRRWRWAGQRVVIAAGLLGLVGLCGMTAVGWAAWAPPVGLVLVGLMLMVVSRWMPQRTTLGIEEAARWRAFRRYLKNLKQFGNLEAAQAVLDRYFPYAVALDVDEVVLREAEKMDAYVPIWMAPAPVNVGTTTGQIQRRRGLRDRVTKELRVPQPVTAAPRAAKVRPLLSERPAGADFSLQGISDNLSSSLNRASRSLRLLLNTAVGEIDDFDSPFEVVVRGAGRATKLSWKAGTTTMKVLGDILEESSSGGGGGGSTRGGFRSSSWSSGGSSFRGGGGSSGRSGGGGSRGFG
ncbi:MAG: DUF2207 domain-containing protein [Anaerolineae bacterium]|jgi:uncharacterized membrane protein YgcG